MTAATPAPWISLNVRYDIPADARPFELLEDADDLFERAHGIAQCLNDALMQTDDFNHGDLANALCGVAMLITMGQRCAQEAQTRMRLAPSPRRSA